MLTKLHVKNFKAHIDTDLDLKPITVFIGPNNSGKSSLFHLLLLYKQSVLDRNTRYRHLYSGGINRIWKGDDVLRIHGNNLVDMGNDPLNLKTNPIEDIYISIVGEVNLKEKEERIIGINKAMISMEQFFSNINSMKKYVYITSIDDKYKLMTKADLEARENGKNELNVENLKSKITINYYGGITTPISISPEYNEKISEKIRKEEDIITKALEKSFSYLIENIRFVYGIRGFELFSEQLILVDEDRLEYLGLPQRSIAIGNTLLSNKELEEKVSDWFDKILGLKFYSEASQGANVVIKIKQKKNKLMINEGLGSQQMLHMLIPIALADELDTIMIEEPEIHLHPKTQSDLSKLFIKVWKDEKKQIIYSTHSEHMIFPILSSISRGEIKKEDVAILYFNKEEDGAVKVRPLEINEKGMVRGGLPGFFEKDLDELIDFLER